MCPLNQAGYMTATELSQFGQEGLARERGPYMTDYGNVRIVDSRWKLRIGEDYPLTPTIIFGKAPQSVSFIARALSLEHG